MDTPKKPAAAKSQENVSENGKAFRNGVLFSIVAGAAGLTIYYLVKERKRRKFERELRDYEIWS